MQEEAGAFKLCGQLQHCSVRSREASLVACLVTKGPIDVAERMLYLSLVTSDEHAHACTSSNMMHLS